MQCNVDIVQIYAKFGCVVHRNRVLRTHEPLVYSVFTLVISIMSHWYSVTVHCITSSALHHARKVQECFLLVTCMQ
jgi:hypothetical protein